METHKEQILIRIAGKDRIGLTNEIMSILSRYDAQILDIGQADIHSTLSLGILIRIDDTLSGQVMKELLFKTTELGVTIGFDIRYPASMTFEQLTGTIDERMGALGFAVKDRSNSLGHYIAPETELVSTLMDVYGELSGDRASKPISIGGGTYAREFKNAVAVGVTRPDRPDLCHIANENILLSEMLFNTRFMAECLKRLAAE